MLMVHHNRLGMVDSSIYQLDKVVADYDEKLFIDRHRETGQWVVFIKLERPHPAYPLFALPEPFPTIHQLREKLQASDTQKVDIRSQMNKANEAHTAEIDRKTKIEIGKAAEAAEFIARKQYMTDDNTSRRKIVKS